MSKKLSKNIFIKRYLLVSHYATYAMQDLLYEYLTKRKAVYVEKVNIPLPELPFLKRIEIEINENGKTTEKYTRATLSGPPTAAYLLHFFQFLWIGFLDTNSYDVAIAENSLLAIACIILKKLRKVRKVIFYSHGVDNKRFGKSLQNRFYSFLDRFAATKSDANWLLSKEMIPVRIKQGVERESISWVPTALPLSEMRRNVKKRAESLLFLGTLNEMNGVMLLPDIMRELIKRFPHISLDVIGDGPLRGKLEEKIRQYHLEKSIHMHGLQRFDEYKDTLVNHLIALAPYQPSSENLLQSTDPMKIRLYMASGLPIITTKGFPFSKEIVVNQLGSAVEYTRTSYCKAIVTLLKNRKTLEKQIQNTLQYSLQFDQEHIFRKPLEKILYG